MQLPVDIEAVKDRQAEGDRRVGVQRHHWITVATSSEEEAFQPRIPGEVLDAE